MFELLSSHSVRHESATFRCVVGNSSPRTAIGFTSYSFTFSGPSTGKNLLYFTSGMHKSRAYGRPADWRQTVAQNIFSIIIAGSFFKHRNAYQITCDGQEAPDNTEVHLITPELSVLSMELVHIALPASINCYIQDPPKKCIHTLTKENSTLYNRLL